MSDLSRHATIERDYLAWMREARQAELDYKFGNIEKGRLLAVRKRFKQAEKAYATAQGREDPHTRRERWEDIGDAMLDMADAEASAGQVERLEELRRKAFDG